MRAVEFPYLGRPGKAVGIVGVSLTNLGTETAIEIHLADIPQPAAFCGQKYELYRKINIDRIVNRFQLKLAP